MKIKKVFISSAVLTVAAAIILIVHGCNKSQSFTFETSRVQKGSITNTVTATGTIEAITSVKVGTQVSGIIEKLYVDFNSPVKKGQLLAEIDKTALKSSVEQSRATLENAKADMEFQTSNFNRSEALFQKNLVSEADYDQAKYNYQQAKASLKSAQAQYDKALVQLSYATIYSPIDGVVMNRAVEEGQTVAASFNTPEIFTIAQDLTQMQVEADIDESDIGMVKEGQRVEFDVDAYPDQKFAGTVMQIRLSPVTTSNVVTYTVVINAPNPDKKLFPGMTANIIIYVEETSDVLVIPYKAVKFTPEAGYLAKMGKEMMADGARAGMPSGGGNMPSVPAGAKTQTMVWVKNEGGIHQVPVELGSNDGDNAEVKSGLKEGDEVVTKMTQAIAKDKKNKEVATNPFMPRRPGQTSTKKTSTKS